MADTGGIHGNFFGHEVGISDKSLATLAGAWDHTLNWLGTHPYQFTVIVVAIVLIVGVTVWGGVAKAQMRSEYEGRREKAREREPPLPFDKR